MTVVWSGPLVDVLANAGGNVGALVNTNAGSGSGFVSAFDRLANGMAPWKFGLIRASEGTFFGQSAHWPARVLCLLLVAALCVACTDLRLRWWASFALASLASAFVSAFLAPPGLAASLAAYTQRIWVVPVMLTWSVVTVAVVSRPRKIDRLLFDRTLLARCIAVIAILVAFGAVVDTSPDGVSAPACSSAVTSLVHGGLAVEDVAVYDSRWVPAATIFSSGAITAGVYAEMLRHRPGLLLYVDDPITNVAEHRLGDNGGAGSAVRLVIRGRSGVPKGGRLLATARFGSSCADAAVSDETLQLWAFQLDE